MASIKNTGATVYLGTPFNDYFADNGSGAQTMIGGLGDDFYFVDNLGDTIVENNGKSEGIDTVQTVGSLNGFVLANHVENLILAYGATGGYTGNAMDNKIDGSLAYGSSLFGGDGADTILGSSSGNTLDGGAGKDSMVGGAGNDRYYVDDTADKVVEDTDGGSDSVYTTATYTLAPNVEDLFLLGDKSINGTGNASNNDMYGNSQANILLGLGGNDVIYGYSGSDKIDGGDGNDYLIGDSGLDQLLGGNGNDYLSGGNDDDKLDGGAGDDELDGDAGNDQLSGAAGNDELDGGDGNDKLDGGDGNDYLFDSYGDDTLIGGAGNDLLITRYYGKDSLDGGAGNDILVIRGDNSDIGLGNKTLNGGAGDDVFYVQAVPSAKNVKIVEASNGGNDTVRLINSGNIVASPDWTEGSASVTNGGVVIQAYTLGANIENLFSDLSSGAKHLTGNTLNNMIVGSTSNDAIIGGAGNDTLDGNAGADNLVGGTGNDTYVVDNRADTVYEENNAAGGVDNVISSVDFRLSAGLENLTLMGTDDIRGLGNNAANTIIGNSGENLIDGGAGNDSLSGDADDDTLYGGAGNDTLNGGTGFDIMFGGVGNDIYYVDNSSDIAIDVGQGGGTDKVISTSSYYQLSDNSFIETLELDASVGDYSYGVGNELANTIIGNDNDNILSDGNDYNYSYSVGTFFSGGNLDTLIGGKGDDYYQIVWDSDGKDKIIDSAGNDTVALSLYGVTTSAFTNITLGSSDLSGIENLTIRGAHSGFGGFNITGSSVANEIDGSNLNDTIDGGSGDDSLYGGGGNDMVKGGIGNDTLSASGGNDTLDGGAGNDSYFLNSYGSYTLVEASNGGTDTVYLNNVSIDLSAVASGFIENAEIYASYSNVVVDGSSLANTLTLVSNSNFYNVEIEGGAGNDSYVVGNAHGSSSVDMAAVTITDSSGMDQLTSYLGSITLGSGIENLILGAATNEETGEAIGYALNGAGNAEDNKIIGNDAGNNIDGGTGEDTMEGGAGDDYYVVDDVDDVIKELANEGNDGVYFVGSGTYVLSDNIEFGYVSSSSNGVNITGNKQDNYLYDGYGNNLLDGGLGNDYLSSNYGNDTLIGGGGDDTFSVFQAATNITELAGGGVDTLYYYGSSAFELAEQVENLFFSDNPDGVTIAGNDLANLIYILPNDTDNTVQTIDGGAGADTMAAGAGNDTYIVDNAGDIVIEMNSAGTDSITLSGVSLFNMASNALNVENLTISGLDVANTTSVTIIGNSVDNTINASANTGDNLAISGGGGDDVIIGGAKADTLDGEDGDDSLSGGNGADTLFGGLGEDTLTGGDGADIFAFTDFDFDNDADLITDFVNGTDKIGVSQSIFDQLGEAIGPDAIGSYDGGSVSWATGKYLALDTNSNILYYDADTDAGFLGKVEIATLNGFTGVFDFNDVVFLP